LLAHADGLFDESRGFAREVDLRRSVSAAYYALFHRINEVSVALVAANVSIETNHRIQRWFEHAKLKEICGRFFKPKLEQPLLGLNRRIGVPTVANSLPHLRHLAGRTP
jgi:hypothetical protein